MDTFIFFESFSTIEWIIIGLYSFFFLIQLFYYLFLFRKPYKNALNNRENYHTHENNLPGISVIITVKDEANNLKKNLPYILNQEYPNFEVIVVNNASTDSTANVLDNFKSKYPNLYVTFIPIGSNEQNNKKLAISIGVKAAKNDTLLFTEIDCKPLSSKWIYEYSLAFTKEKSVILGCCQIEFDKGFSSKYIQYENLFNGIQYASLALANQPYMGLGRNMAFKKSVFINNKGFSSILNIEGGEDNLFINKVANKSNTKMLTMPESMVVCNDINGLNSWRNMKANYQLTKKYYKGIAKRIVGFEVFSRYLFYTLFVILSIIGVVSNSPLLIIIAFTLFLIRLAIQLIIINKNSKIFNAGNFYTSLPIFDLLLPINNYLHIYKYKRKN